jgi:hypothetical protein
LRRTLDPTTSKLKEWIMKLHIPLAAAVAAVFFLSSPAVLAADEKPAESATADPKPVQPKAKVQPHSHVAEKTGTPQTAPAPQTDKANPATDTSKHYHPRDMK